MLRDWTPLVSGVIVEGEGTTTMRNNEVRGCSGAGVEVRGANGVVLEENDIHSNGAEGLRLIEGANVSRGDSNPRRDSTPQPSAWSRAPT